MPATKISLTQTNWSVVVAATLLFGLIVWTFWPAIGDMAEKWQTDPQYSHGYLVPIFAVGLAIWRRNRLDQTKCRCDWRGLILITIGAIGYVVGGYLYLDFACGGALIPTLLGAALLLGGPAALRWSWPMIAFLAFMVPLPYRLESALGGPLQGIATSGSTWLLQTIGLPAVSEGNVILLEQGRIAVVEACNGLSMLLTFAAMTTAVAMVSTRPLLDRILVVLSTIPVALAVNIARITGNGIAIEAWDVQTAHRWFHDQGGWMMMPLALGLLAVELWVLGRLFPPASAAPVASFVGRPAALRKPVAAAR